MPFTKFLQDTQPVGLLLATQDLERAIANWQTERTLEAYQGLLQAFQALEKWESEHIVAVSQGKGETC